MVQMKIGDVEVRVVRGSVVDQDVDVIVNAAKADLRGGGGIDGIIHQAAGPEMLDYLVENYPDPLDPGKVGISPGFELNQPWVVHAPGPMWKGGIRDEHLHLAAVYRNSLVEASNKGAESIAFCSISTGIYKYPLMDATKVAVQSIAGWLTKHPESSIKKVVFAMYAPAEFDAFLTQVKQLGNAKS